MRCIYTYDFEFTGSFNVRNSFVLTNNTNFQKIIFLANSYDTGFVNILDAYYKPYYYFENDYYVISNVSRKPNITVSNNFTFPVYNLNNILQSSFGLNRIFTNIFKVNYSYDIFYKYYKKIINNDDNTEEIYNLTLFIATISDRNRVIYSNPVFINSSNIKSNIMSFVKRTNILDNINYDLNLNLVIRGYNNLGNTNKKNLNITTFDIRGSKPYKKNENLPLIDEFYNIMHSNFFVKTSMLKNRDIDVDNLASVNKLNEIKEMLDNIINNTTDPDVLGELSVIYDTINELIITINNNDKISVDEFSKIIRKIKTTLNQLISLHSIIDNQQIDDLINDLIDIAKDLYIEYDDKIEANTYQVDIIDTLINNYIELLDETRKLNFGNNTINQKLDFIYNNILNFNIANSDFINNINYLVEYIINNIEIMNDSLTENLNITSNKFIEILNILLNISNSLIEYNNTSKNKYNDVKSIIGEANYYATAYVKISPYYVYNMSNECLNMDAKKAGDEFVYCITYPVGEFRTFFMLDNDYINKGIRIKAIRGLPFGLKYDGIKIYGRVISHKVIDNIYILLTNGEYIRVKFIPENEYITR